MWKTILAATLLVAVGLAGGCFFTYDCADDETCAPGTGGTGGNDGGPPPSCIPSMNSTPVADSCGVFVSSVSGQDTPDAGTREAPFKTITAALAKGSTLYVCAGTPGYK